MSDHTYCNLEPCEDCLKDRLETARGLLAPFAEYAELLAGCCETDQWIGGTTEDGREVGVTVADFFAVRAYLSSGEGE